MSVVKINAVTVPEGMGDDFIQRFAKRAGSVENQPGFEEFLLLKPSDDNTRFFVFTRWESEEAFNAWMQSRDFAKAHAHVAEEEIEHAMHHDETPGAPPHQASGHPGGHPGAGGPPVGIDAELLAFDVVERVTAPTS